MGALQGALQSIVTSTERAGTVTGQVAELLLENRAALRTEIDRLDATVQQRVGEILAHTSSTAQVVAALDERLSHLDVLVQGVGARLQDSSGLDALLSELRADVGALRSAAEQAPSTDIASGIAAGITAGVNETVHREAELLTQRVAALSVTLEGIRALMATHAEDTANSLGRKASEVGRKLAGDLGIRPKKAPASRSKAADSKQIGPGR
jgi:chaperonin cofactor prefoldin